MNPARKAKTSIRASLAYDFADLDGASLSFFAHAPQVIATLLGLGVDVGDELVLDFPDGAGGFG